MPVNCFYKVSDSYKIKELKAKFTFLNLHQYIGGSPVSCECIDYKYHPPLQLMVCSSQYTVRVLVSALKVQCSSCSQVTACLYWRYM